ncbi:MAG: DNA-binding response regulator, partial [Deinococcus-Thermus bacterium]|nr:DNA-binding response regulator [Deinococcota bacterium]
MSGAPSDEAIRVLIADDHPLFRMGLAHALRARGFDVVAEAENGRNAVDLG